MKVKDLVSALKALTVKHPRKGVSVGFTCVLVEAYQMTVSDSATWTTVKIETGVREPTCFPVFELLNIVKHLPEGAKVTFKYNLVLCNETQVGAILSMPGKYFPESGCPKVEMDTFTVDIKSLKDTSLFKSEEDVRFYVNGIYFDTDNLLIKATDGHRLYQTPMGMGATGVRPFIMRGVQLEKVCSVFKSGDVTVATNGGFVIVERGGVYVISKCIEGNFPDFGRVIPKKDNLTVKLRIEEFERALRKLGKTTDQEYQRLYLKVQYGRAVLSSTGGDLLELTCKVTDSLDLRDKEASFCFNYGYMLDVLKVLGSQRSSVVELRMTHKEEILTPCKIESEGDTFIVMPMKGKD